MVNKGKIRNAKQEDFNDLYLKKIKDSSADWKDIFSSYLSRIDDFSISDNFWFIADFKTNKILRLGGNYETQSVFTKKQWFALKSPMEMAKMFHPMDVNKMQSFIVFYANYIGNKNFAERKKVKVSMSFRMLNAMNQYTWRLMQYPHIHFSGKHPRYLLCVISEYEHLLTSPVSSMYIHDASLKNSTLFYCEEAQVELKPINERNSLTNRELEVVKLLCEGMISKEIAAKLNLSKNTIENHKQNIFSKTKTSNLAALITYAHINILNKTII